MPIEITMPRLSDTMETGTIIKWNVSAGDAVSAGDIVADIETDKATMEMQVYDDGIVASIVVPEGQTVDVGTLIAVLAEEDEDVAQAASSAGEARGGAAAEASGAERPAPAATVTAAAPEEPAAPPSAPPPAPARTVPPRGNGRMRVSPVARQIAADHDVDLGSIEGSGPGGRIIKRDVLQAIETGRETAAAVPPSARPPAEPVEEPRETLPATRVPTEADIVPSETGLATRRVPLSGMRQTIARRLVESKTTIPHYQVTTTFAMDAILELRRTLNAQLEAQHVRLSVNDLLVKACALAMYEHPEVNASWGEDHIDIHGDVNIGVAVSLPTERGGGLVVATIRDADRKSLRVISAETRQLAEKARTRGLSVEEMADATFTISNLGMFGVEHFTAIINPPNSAILAVGAALQKPVVRDGELTVGWEMSATLSLDHRVIDGAMAAQYLQTLKRMIENPATLLV
ncbi:MAG: dihydrolipoamide acetyltransferase family protein [Planctomycetota bacterium]|jgi:pyruvate dehydrogenase E2 component (dihydrolipoamide acetyltransferase)